MYICAKFRLDRFGLLPLSGEKNQVLPHFQLRHPVMAQPSGVNTKLNMGAQLQTFHYPTISKPLKSSNASWAKLFSQTSSFESVTDRKTDKNPTILVTRRRAKSQPHRTWHGDERTSSMFLHLQKRLGVRSIASQLEGGKIWR